MQTQLTLDSRDDPWWTGEPVIIAERRDDAWEALVATEPRLLALKRDLIAGRRERNYWPAWSQASARLRQLVGWGADHPQLRTSAAYEVAYRHLLTAFDAGQEEAA